MTTRHEKELKKPDTFHLEGRRILVIFEKNKNAILVGIVFIALVVSGILLMSRNSEKKELALQADYYRIEKSYLKKMEEAEKAKNEKLEKETKLEQETIEKNSKDKNSKDKKVTKAVEEKKAFEPEVNKLEKYSYEISEFKALIDKAPESKAAAMAALLVANLYFESKNWEEGQKLLSNVYAHQKNNNLIKGLLVHSLGVSQANMGKCEAAIQTWAPLLKDKSYDFMADELKLKTAICQQQLGQSQQAEELLNAIKSKPDSPQSKVAEKYLRFFKRELLNKKQGS